MRAGVLPLMLGASLSLGGCAALPFAPALADVAYSAANGISYGPEQMNDAATSACRSYAYRYGRVMSIDRIEPLSSTTVRVVGSIQYPSGIRPFTCTFRNDGRITSFDRA